MESLPRPESDAQRKRLREVLTNVSAFCVLPASDFLDLFHLVRDWDDRPVLADGGEFKRRKKPYVKNAGGGLEFRTISVYLGENELGDVGQYGLPFSNDFLTDLSPEVLCGIFGTLVWDGLLKLGAVAEIWEELDFFIHPSEFGLVTKLLERHVPNRRHRDDPRIPHVRAIMGIDKPFLEEPTEGFEIAEWLLLSPEQIVRWSPEIAEDHYRAFSIFHEAHAEGRELKPFFECGVRDCLYCEQDSDRKGGV